MLRVANIFRSCRLRLLYDLFLLSMKITVAMVVATIKVVLPGRLKNLLGETVVVNENEIRTNGYQEIPGQNRTILGENVLM